MSDVLNNILEKLHEPVSLLLLQLLIILIVSRAFGLLFKKLNQPTVIGEIVAGIVIGVSGLGMLFPEIFNYLFPEKSYIYLEILSKLGLALFMFIIGIELDLHLFKQQSRKVITLSISSIVVPCITGVFLYSFLYHAYGTIKISYFVFVAFIAISLSITAFPVLARIISARGMGSQSIGKLALSCAAVADLLNWCLLSIVVAMAKAGSLQAAIPTIVFAFIFIVLMAFVVRPWLRKILLSPTSKSTGNYKLLVVAFILLLFSALCAEIIGLHILFGAFLAGVIMPRNEEFTIELNSKIEAISVHLFLPVFFAFNGLRLQIIWLNVFSLWTLFIIIIVAMLGKFLGSLLPAKWVGLPTADALRLGALMNTRGLMELVVLNIGLEAGILSTEIFTLFVLMAILTTLATNPLLDLIDKFAKRKEFN
ncbi:MAG: cation:proton antiporter [Bacteroidetes bacterium]|nr:cation:proton antiporter [Bacteroidota bacterium]